MPKEYIPGVTKGLEEMMSSGSLAGFPVVDVKTVLYDGSYHEVDSSALAFQIAARGAFREAMQKCGARLLEPVMKVRGWTRRGGGDGRRFRVRLCLLEEGGFVLHRGWIERVFARWHMWMKLSVGRGMGEAGVSQKSLGWNKTS